MHIKLFLIAHIDQRGREDVLGESPLVHAEGRRAPSELPRIFRELEQDDANVHESALGARRKHHARRSLYLAQSSVIDEYFQFALQAVNSQAELDKTATDQPR